VQISVTAADGTGLVARRTGRGTPVVLVHGSAGGLDSWDPVVPLLDDEFEVWVHARRGYAPSDGCRRPKTYADDVSDLRAVLAAAGKSAHVVGASHGGTVALHAALAGDPAIRSVVVFEPPLFAAGAELMSVLEPYRRLVEAGDLTAASRLFAERVARVPAPLLAALDRAAAAPRDAAQQAAMPAEAVGCRHDLEAMAADTVDLDRWAGVRVPALLLQGSETWAPMPATMAALGAALPVVTRVILPGQSHFATHTAPELFAGAVRRFLRGQG
jgi:pimeloyl-ACP methyl ester carboxylesterase